MQKLNTLLIVIGLLYSSNGVAWFGNYFSKKSHDTIQKSDDQKKIVHKKIDIQKIMDYPIPRVLARYQKDYNVSPELSREHERELKRYFILIHQFPEEHFEMYSAKVDDLWHTFLLFTQDYQQFCGDMFGYFIHHHPFD